MASFVGKMGVARGTHNFTRKFYIREGLLQFANIFSQIKKVDNLRKFSFTDYSRYMVL